MTQRRWIIWWETITSNKYLKISLKEEEKSAWLVETMFSVSRDIVIHQDNITANIQGHLKVILLKIRVNIYNVLGQSVQPTQGQESKIPGIVFFFLIMTFRRNPINPLWPLVTVTMSLTANKTIFYFLCVLFPPYNLSAKSWGVKNERTENTSCKTGERRRAGERKQGWRL